MKRSTRKNVEQYTAATGWHHGSSVAGSKWQQGESRGQPGGAGSGVGLRRYIPGAWIITRPLAVVAVAYRQINHCARDGIKIYNEVVLPGFWCTTQ